MIDISIENMNDYLDLSLMHSLMATANKSAIDSCGLPEKEKRVTGQFLVRDVKLVDKNNYNIWVEYLIEHLEEELAIILTRISIYQEDTPDEILDRYNDFKQLSKNQ